MFLQIHCSTINIMNKLSSDIIIILWWVETCLFRLPYLSSDFTPIYELLYKYALLTVHLAMDDI